jgi:cytidylate kinase
MIDLEEILENLKKRDIIDSTREEDHWYKRRMLF